MKRRVHVEILLAGEAPRTTAAREHWLAGRRRRHLAGPEGRQSVAGVRHAERAVAVQLAEPVSSRSGVSDVGQPLIEVR